MSATLIEAVQAIAPSLSEADRQVLQALLFAPHHAASAGQLRVILGLNAVVQVNGAMGRIGRKVHEAFGGHPDGLAPGDFEWWHVIATGQATRDRGFVWQLRDDVVAGLNASGYSETGHATPNEVGGAETFTEGAVRQVTVNAYERNPVARSRCINAYGAHCYICGFDFGVMYGASAAGFIHVHHTKALATIGEQYEVNPIEDLRPVCPNCHAVIHMTDPARSIEEVKGLLSAKEAPNIPPDECERPRRPVN
jgi:hypothetical protein